MKLDSRSSSRVATYYAQNRPAILSIGTALPRYEFKQSAVSDWMSALFADRPAVARLVRSLHNASGIETRYSCNPDYLLPPRRVQLCPRTNRASQPDNG